MTNREMLESALKRVNALLGVNGKLYNDNTGWYVIWKSNCRFSESAMSAGELLAYLHGIEDMHNDFKQCIEDVKDAPKERKLELINLFNKAIL